MSKNLFKINKKLGKGLATLCKVEKRDLKELISNSPSNNFIFIHFGVGTETDFSTVKKFIGDIGIQEKDYMIDIYPGYAHGFIHFKQAKEAEALSEAIKSNNDIEATKIKDNFKNIKRIDEMNENKQYLSKCVNLDFDGKYRYVFFFNTALNSEDMRCGSGQSNSLPSAITDPKDYESKGLTLVKDFISEKEESDIIDEILKNPWENLSHRRVQHYGFKFLYGANSINTDEKQGELPDFINTPLDLLKDHNLPAFDQCTVNEYKPGNGIPPHIDSHAPFEEELVSVSMLSDIVMLFKNPITKEELHLLLPRRSALILRGEMRYLWNHSIAVRKVDRVETNLIFRRRRISLTYRKSKKVPSCSCKYEEYCDFAKKQAKPVEMEGAGEELENKYVKNVYNSIAEHFSHTRYKPWPTVKAFLDKLPKHSIIGDIGCGNGKYMFCTDDKLFIGTDIAESFTQIVKKKDRNAQTLVSDITNTPFQTSSLDYAISIAVIHHLSNTERRLKAISELFRIIRKGGSCLIYVWAYEQDKKFGGKDVFVPWNNQPKFENKVKETDTEKKVDEQKNTIVYKRYYHLFDEGELEELVVQAADKYGYTVEIKRAYYDHENWCVEVYKHN